jgi:hypothetical protein
MLVGSKEGSDPGNLN